jgi:hypothetical protein
MESSPRIAISGFGRLSFYTRDIIATWGNLHLALALAILLAAFLDVATRTRRDWLHYFGLAVIWLDAMSIVLSFGSPLAKWWSDLYSHVVG